MQQQQELLMKHFLTGQGRKKRLSDYMIKRILREIPYSRLNGSRECRVTGNMNFSFQYVNGGMLVVMLNKQGICASAGSACTSNSGKAITCPSCTWA